MIQVPIKGLKVHLKVDTGMHRIGTEKVAELQAMLSLLKANGADVEGIFTHFACSDNPDNQMTEDQAARFEAVVDALKTPFRWVHSCNSDAAVHYPKAPGNAVRCGLAMFGVTSYLTEAVYQLIQPLDLCKTIKGWTVDWIWSNLYNTGGRMDRNTADRLCRWLDSPASGTQLLD